MYREKKILAIIPARSGSKGLKNKNIKKICGKHLIGYTIEAAVRSNVFEDIIVSTDSEEYAKISREYGASVPFLRKKELSTDTTATTDVIIDLINRLDKEYDYFVLLQPTSPLRNYKHIIEAVDLAVDNDLNSVVSMCEVEHSPTLMNTLNEDKDIKGFINHSKRRQDMEKYYRINGAIYISKVDSYIIKKNFYEEKSKAYLMSKKDSVDIDDEFDFILAKNLMIN